MFKADWEKTSIRPTIPKGFVEKIVNLTYPNKKLISFEVIAGGCSNLNYAIRLEHEKHPLILRIYLRDKDAAYREQKLAARLKETVPLPLTHSILELDGYLCAITECMHGIVLRDLLLSNTPYDISAVMHEVGMTLAKIIAHEFPEAGFLNKELRVIPYASSDIIRCTQACLNDTIVLSVLDPSLIEKIKKITLQHAHVFSTSKGNHLVHGDFDPANILVDRINGSWIVTGVLDWEFAFSGSYLWDIANMLRYAHKMAPEFQDSFLGALQNHVTLPIDWQTTAHVLNVSSLLDLLRRSNPQNHPNTCTDIRELLTYIVSELNNT